MAVNGGKLDSGIIEFAGANTPGWISNLGCSISGGVFTIHDAQGAALTTSNPGWITCPSTTPGQIVTLKITTNINFNDDSHASSNFTNRGFGITETANWTSAMPFFIYVVNRGNTNIDGTDGNSKLFIARNPVIVQTSSSSNQIGDLSTISVNDDCNSIMIIGEVTIANYTTLPVQLIGGFRMSWSTATDDWTIRTFATEFVDGIGQTFLDKLFSQVWAYPTGQNGAPTNTHILANGGTAPLWDTTDYYYTISRSGEITCHIYFEGDPGTDGAGAVDTFVTIPIPQDGNTINFVSGTVSIFGGGTYYKACDVFLLGDYFTIYRPSITGANITNANEVTVTNDFFVAGDRRINGQIKYKGFNTV